MSRKYHLSETGKLAMILFALDVPGDTICQMDLLDNKHATSGEQCQFAVRIAKAVDVLRIDLDVAKVTAGILGINTAEVNTIEGVREKIRDYLYRNIPTTILDDILNS